MDTYAIPRIYTSNINQGPKKVYRDAGEGNPTAGWGTSSSKRKFSKKGRVKIGRYALVILFVAFLVIFGRRPLLGLLAKYLAGGSQTSVMGEQTVQSEKIQIGKEFNFTGIDDTGKKSDELKLTIADVEKTDQVIVQEKTYTSKNEKTFLIVNLELKNDTTKRLNIFPGDLVRLVVDEDQEKQFAPDLHNNYVLVAPLSTKVDRIGFVIDKSAKDLKLQVGELEEKKEIIDLKF